MRESRTYGSGRGACHETHVPTATGGRYSRVGTSQSRALEEGMTKPDTPFSKHWLYYIGLKYVVIAAALLIAPLCPPEKPHRG
jgi:hypothetical protein